MGYILRITNDSFIKSLEGDLVITSNYKKAIIFNTIGDAMRAAVTVNQRLGQPIASVVSNKL